MTFSGKGSPCPQPPSPVPIVALHMWLLQGLALNCEGSWGADLLSVLRKELARDGWEEASCFGPGVGQLAPQKGLLLRQACISSLHAFLLLGPQGSS